VRQRNRTDPESAKLATGKGVLQGYTGVAAVDGTHQIIVEAQAHGTGAEQEVLLPVVDALAACARPRRSLTADAGYHSEANLRALATQASTRSSPTPRCASATHASDVGTRTGTRPTRCRADGRRAEPRVFQPPTSRMTPRRARVSAPLARRLHAVARTWSRAASSPTTFRGAKAHLWPVSTPRAVPAHARPSATRQVRLLPRPRRLVDRES
jgi:hypothetical protein